MDPHSTKIEPIGIPAYLNQARTFQKSITMLCAGLNQAILLMCGKLFQKTSVSQIFNQM